jgi:membrane-associated protein
VTPFLPGDSLLFALGAIAAVDGSPLNVWALFVLLAVAGILGDAVNYTAGKFVGPKVFTSETSWLLNRQHLVRTQHFYERHGGKTIILARFMPIIRTFAPFVAGIGTMSYSRFVSYNVIGAVAWVGSFLGMGFFFGNLPVVKSNFHLVLAAIIVLSVLPPVIEWYRTRSNSAK